MEANRFNTISLLFACLQSITRTAGDMCTKVHDIHVDPGKSADLLCVIKNITSNPTYLMKNWNFISQGASKHVYKILRTDSNDSSSDIDDVGVAYRSRVTKLNDDLIRLNGVTVKDNGEYSCSWEVRPNIPGCFGVITKFTLTVAVSNVRATVTSPLREGLNANFRCTASGGAPITYTWQKLGGKLPDAARWRNQTDGSITLNAVKRTDAGGYTCTADNSAKKPKTSGWARLDVYYAPSKVQLTSSVSLNSKENTQVTLTCTEQGGHPPPDVAIYRGPVKQPSPLTTKLQRSDHRRAIVCKATGPGISGEMTSNKITYNVFFPHSVRITASPNNVREGQNCVLTCHAFNGNPAEMQRLWIRSPGLELTTPQYMLRNVTYKDGGSYVCRVTNQGGTSSGSFYLSVQFAPKMDPRFRYDTTFHADYGDSVTFRLKVIAHPPPSFSWSYEYVSREFKPNIKVTTLAWLSIVTITNVRRDDFTTYLCKVKNSIGTSTFSFVLKASASPLAPTDVNVIYVTAVSATLSWRTGFNGGFSQTFNVMYKDQASSLFSQITNITDPGEGDLVEYKISNLTSNSTFEIRIQAVNARPTDNRSPFTALVTTVTKDKPTVAENSFNVFRQSKSKTATASWSKPAGFYTDMRIEICSSSAGPVCRLHNVTQHFDQSQSAITSLDPDETYWYTLMLYDNGDVVYTSMKITAQIQGVIDSVLIGVVVSMLVIIIAVVAGTTVYCLRRRANPDSGRQHTCSENFRKKFRIVRETTERRSDENTNSTDPPEDGVTDQQSKWKNIVSSIPKRPVSGTLEPGGTIGSELPNDDYVNKEELKGVRAKAADISNAHTDPDAVSGAGTSQVSDEHHTYQNVAAYSKNMAKCQGTDGAYAQLQMGHNEHIYLNMHKKRKKDKAKPVLKPKPNVQVKAAKH